MPCRYFCTYFDHRYLTRGLSLYHSLQRHCPNFQLWVLCLDEHCHAILKQMDLPEVRLLRLEELETYDTDLAAVKGTRTLVEYYFTCTPALPLFVLHLEASIDLITYVDADLFFFSSLEPAFDEIENGSIAMIAHRFSPALKYMEASGHYNVGWLSFRRDASGLACLNWWRERCIEWCYDRIEDERFADQKYLNAWPEKFSGVIVIQNVGVGLAPWNLAKYSLSKADEIWMVDNQPLIMFHFQGLRQMTGWLFDTGLYDYRVKSSQVIKEAVYYPYVRQLVEAGREVSVPNQKIPHSARLRFRSGDSPLRYVAAIVRGRFILIRNWVLGYCVLVLAKTLI